MKDWIWNEAENCWLTTSAADGAGGIRLAIAGTSDCLDSALCECMSVYASQVPALAEMISVYLARRPIHVYGGFEDPNQSTVVIHPEPLPVDINDIEIPDLTQPNCVHVFAYTCYPDPYYLYEITFEDRVITQAIGGFW